MTVHEASCAWWSFGPCRCPRPWRIRQDSEAPYAWSVYRLTGDDEPGGPVVDDDLTGYELLMRCTSFRAAQQLVASLIWLAAESSPVHTRGTRHAR